MTTPSKHDTSRRRFIQGFSALAAVGTLPIGPALAATTPAPAAHKPEAPEPAPGLPRVWGAVYVPSERMNSYQCWWKFDPEQLDREIGYAPKINLNALRMWLSYDRWLEDPNLLQQQLDTLLSITEKHKVRVLLSLFDSDGLPGTPENMKNTSPTTGYQTSFPPFSVTSKPALWGKPKEYIDWFMGRYKNDPRLLAIEIINEPGKHRRNFAVGMLEHAASQRGAVRLTIGAIAPKSNRYYVDHGMDVMQSHPNFMHSEEGFEKFRTSIEKLVAEYKMEYWATEWQRIRPNGLGWHGDFPKGDEWKPDYRSLAGLFQQHRVNGFFWSLMLHPSFLKVHPTKRWLNGVFHPDGSVYSLADARAIAKDPTLQFNERPDWPDWAAGCKKLLEQQD